MRRGLVATVFVAMALLAPALPAAAHDGGHVRKVQVRDRCDPATFNAAVGPGTCAAHKGNKVTFAEFVSFLNPVDFGHPKWQNKPKRTHIDSDESLSATVRGGEFHTFTEVAAFGPGCVPFINDALGLTGPAPTEAECGAIAASTGIVPGGPSLKVSGLAPGKHLFMCMIHPWMRTTVNVRNDDDDD